MKTLETQDSVRLPPWVRDDTTQTYYHEEWSCVPLQQSQIFEHMCLFIFQQGLQWSTVLSFRLAFTKVFAGFDPKKLAQWGDADTDKVLGNSSTIRNRAKIEACIHNAAMLVEHSVHLPSELLARFPDPLVVCEDDASLPKTHILTDEFSDFLKDCGLQRMSPVLTCSLAQACGLLISQQHVRTRTSQGENLLKHGMPAPHKINIPGGQG
ncbi:DNA-3-methyladenine glycosylase I [Rothia sp. ZJ1223]|uniref:DNA-3-methyladenine glycosylase I n=1 Tax=Rothia sp. ZJ1223 TaxID=2811098 RepID=UPI00195D9A3C|nr:DNA-3-methyladenine glycosylase I [Rothia sp. ZJ1223]MBM7050879.1 DNA-3-methyladenine glycosylase I [Rothia sp. ZJ1223]